MADNNLTRYAVIGRKNPREIVLLRGSGCAWGKCAFCDYHLDSSADEAANFALNSEVLSCVTGAHERLETINSGSFFELGRGTIRLIEETCLQRGIKILHIESHWMYREKIPALKSQLARLGVALKAKTGVETFNCDFREGKLQKGIAERDPAGIARHFDEACLLFGLSGQTEESMREDLSVALAHFERVCVNIMCENGASLKPDKSVIATFAEKIFPQYADNGRVDILMENFDFGVGRRNAGLNRSAAVK